MIMKVALYARVCAQSQKAIAAQIAALRTHAKQQKDEVVEDYVCCDDGYSGTLLARPGLDRLRGGAQAGAFEAVLILSPDRLSRNCAHWSFLVEEFVRCGTRVIFPEQSLWDDPRLVSTEQSVLAMNR
jgi:site-specific DNA recombinase